MTKRWTKEQISQTIAAIKKWQSNQYLHPLTCGNNSNHAPLIAWQVEGRVVLACTECDYIQAHIPQAVLSAQQSL